MKVNVVHDENGKVVATFEHAAAGDASIAPLLQSGESVHEIEAAENYLTDIKAFYEKHSTVKVNVVHDENGKVVATFEHAAAGDASIAPILRPGESVHEIEAAGNYLTDIKAFYRKYSK
jgi:ribosomal protein L35AE/L33A